MNKEGGSGYISERFRRLMPPYFITCFLVICAKFLLLFFVSKIRAVTDLTSMIGFELLKTFYASPGQAQITAGTVISEGVGLISVLPALFFALIILRSLSQRIKNNYILGALSAAFALSALALSRFIILPFSIEYGVMGVFILWLGRTVLAAENGLGRFIKKIIGRASDMHITARHFITIICAYSFSDAVFAPSKRLALAGFAGSAAGWLGFLINLAVCLLGMTIVFLITGRIYSPIKKAYLKRGEADVRGQRDVTVDVARGLLMISMLVGHFQIAGNLRDIIYSCHMIAFVFLSGYFYKKTKSIGRALAHMARTFLLPYAICVVVILLIHMKEWSGAYILHAILTYVLGFSFSDRLLPDIGSVGPIYFILLLFVVRLLYMLIDRLIKSEALQWVVIFCLAAAGVLLGVKGFWLPWSIDVALYCIVFYKAGVTFRKYDLLSKMGRNHWIYFILSPIWAFMIYRGSMEIAVRNYGSEETLGLVIVGALCGTLVIYILAAYISTSMVFSAKVLDKIGEASLIILALHTAFNDVINSLLAKALDPSYAGHMVISIVLQLVAGTLIYLLINFAKRKIRHI